MALHNAMLMLILPFFFVILLISTIIFQLVTVFAVLRVNVCKSERFIPHETEKTLTRIGSKGRYSFP